MFREVILLYLISILYQMSHCAQLYTVTLDRAEVVNSTYSPGFYNLSMFRIAKLNRTAFGLNVMGEMFIDFDEKVFFECDAYYKRSQNQEYTRSIYTMARKPFPEHSRVHYDLAKNFLDELAKHSNIPPFPPKEVPYIWKKGPIWVKNFFVPLDGLPPYLPLGYYQTNFVFSTKDVTFLVFRLYVQIEGRF